MHRMLLTAREPGSDRLVQSASKHNNAEYARQQEQQQLASNMEASHICAAISIGRRLSVKSDA